MGAGEFCTLVSTAVLDGRTLSTRSTDKCNRSTSRKCARSVATSRLGGGGRALSCSPRTFILAAKSWPPTACLSQSFPGEGRQCTTGNRQPGTHMCTVETCAGARVRGSARAAQPKRQDANSRAADGHWRPTATCTLNVTDDCQAQPACLSGSPCSITVRRGTAAAHRMEGSRSEGTRGGWSRSSPPGLGSSRYC